VRHVALGAHPCRSRPYAQGCGGVFHWQPVKGDELEHGALVFREPRQRQVRRPAGALRVDAFFEPGDVIVIQEPAAGHPARRAHLICGAAPLPGDEVPCDPVQPRQLRPAAGAVGARRGDRRQEDLGGQVGHGMRVRDATGHETRYQRHVLPVEGLEDGRITSDLG